MIGTEILNLVAVGTGSEGNQSKTRGFPTPGANNSETVHFLMDVTAIVGTGATFDVDVVGTVGGIDFIFASFPQVLLAGGAIKHKLTVADCPSEVKMVYAIAGTSPLITATIQLLVP